MTKVLYNGCLFYVMDESGDEYTIRSKKNCGQIFTVLKAETQPMVDRFDVSEEVFRHIEEYLERHSLLYNILDVQHNSEHPDDRNCYMVIGKNRKTGMFACWTCWNESRLSLEHGHYDLLRLEDAQSICCEHYHRLVF